MATAALIIIVDVIIVDVIIVGVINVDVINVDGRAILAARRLP